MHPQPLHPSGNPRLLVSTSAIADCNTLAASDFAILSAARANASATLSASGFSDASTAIAAAPPAVTTSPSRPAPSGLSTSLVAAASTSARDAVASFSAPSGAVTASDSMSPARSPAASAAGGPFPGDSTGLQRRGAGLDPVGRNGEREAAQLQTSAFPSITASGSVTGPGAG